MTPVVTPRSFFFIWLTVLASPIAWSVSLLAMFWLTNPVCQGLSRSALTLTGVLCALVSVIGAFAAGRALNRTPKRAAEDSEDVPVFLLRLAMWGGLMFALVIALSLVPTALLTPCPV